jgi:phosphoribosylamine--glycine ligase
VGYGKIQDELRSEGYNVFGGSWGGDRLEKERDFAQIMFSTYGIKGLRTYNFPDIDSAMEFVENKKGKWVIKQNGHMSALNYVGCMEDGSDVLGVLSCYKDTFSKIKSLSLQERVDGVEIGVARYFNGNDWVGPIEMNVEHKRLFNGGIGPMTGEMGTVMWYEKKENRIFRETLSKMKPFLKDLGFRGDIDINFIVNKNNVFPLEATCRLGCPSTQLQDEIHLSKWKDFLMAVAKGEKYNLKYKKGFGVIVSVAIPPFPYKSISNKFYTKNAPVVFKKKINKKEMDRIHFEEVSLGKNGTIKIAGGNGYILYVSGFGKNIEMARKQAYSLVDKIVIPKMMYRTDIGERLINNDYALLKKWGWI